MQRFTGIESAVVWSVISYVKPLKQRGLFGLTPLGKRHLRRSGSHLLSHFANHKLDLFVGHGIF